METHPKVLGPTLDPKFTYSTDIHISTQAHTPLQMIKALTATGWDQQKQTLMATYKDDNGLGQFYRQTCKSK